MFIDVQDVHLYVIDQHVILPEHPNEHPDVQSMFILCEKLSTPSILSAT